MNKRWFALVLILILLPSCTGEQNETAPSEALYETKPTDSVGFSFFDVPETGGAVRSVEPDIHESGGFRFMGDDILVFSGYGNTELTLLDGCTFAVKAEASLTPMVSPEDSGVTVSPGGITYVDSAARELVFLNTKLEETKRIPLPEGCGNALLSADQQLLYYCTAEALRVLDLATGMDRPVKEMHFPKQEVTALHCGGSILQCNATYDDGNVYTLFVSTETGRLLYETQEDMPLWTDGDLYFSTHMDGPYRELLSGSPDFGPSLLVTEEESHAITPVLARRLVLLHSQNPDGGISLDAYHLETGRHTASVTLPEQYRITDIQPSPQGDTLWLLCHDGETDEDILCSWDLTMSDPEDSRNYLQPRWNRGNPDLEGLAQCEELAAKLSEQYGIEIRLWADAAKFDCEGYCPVPEYQVPLIKESLDILDRTLSRYPEGFLQELAEPTDSGNLHICLVRSIGQEDFPDADLKSLLLRDNRGEIWLAVTPGQDLDRQINQLLCDLIDCRVLGVSDTYDSWDRSSPTGSGHQERIQILEKAMTDDQAAYFASGAMQSKLRLLCLGIWETFRTVRSAEEPFWEQHLADIT